VQSIQVLKIFDVIEKAKQSGGLFTAKILFFLLMRFTVSVNHNKTLGAVEKDGLH
jgi:hypothetical protein